MTRQSFMSSVGAQLASRRAVTSQIESVTPVSDKVIRIVASYNQTPNKDEVLASIVSRFDGKAKPVEGSYRIHSDGDRVVVAGYVTNLDITKPLDATAGMREIAKNVFMDDEDNTVWQISGDQIVRAAKENLAEIASTIEVRKVIGRNVRELAELNVQEFAGVKNTQMVAYVDSETAALLVGVRVGEDHVWSETAGVQEIAQDQVVNISELNGADYIEGPAAETASTSLESMIDYYRELYKYDPAFFALVEKQLRERSLA